MNVEEIMTAKLCTTGPEATVAEAATLMGERHVGSILIVDGDRLLGILTERDIVRALSSTHDAPTRAVEEWMTRDPVTIEPGASVQKALRAMMDGGFRHLPVADGGVPVGVLSIRDLAGAFAE
ncbi:MAG TPA: CBS domain-containing protein [Actinomycetota bacterium]